MSPRRSKPAEDNRAVIVGGRRTPFVGAAGDLQTLDVLDLAKAATNELLSNYHPDDVDSLIFGNVSRPVKYHNLAREVVLSTSLPNATPAHTVSLACTSSCVAATNGIDAIERGYAGAVIVGGSESLSNVPIQYSARLSRALLAAGRAKTPVAKVQTLATVRMGDLKPVAAGITETSTGLSMGQSAEEMAKVSCVTREEQDQLALDSHLRAAAELGDMERESQITPVIDATRGRAIERDNHIRLDTSLAKLAALRPVFDKGYGTVTAGNSSPLTDGASAMLLMSETRAKVYPEAAKARIRSYAYAAVDPAGQLLLGPAYAIPIALDRAGITLGDVDVVELHEAFAAQVMSTLKCLASKQFAATELGRSKAVGEIDRERLNIGGGSIALGHPFGATGVRVLMDLVRHLHKVDGEIGLASVCAAGGVGCAIVVERM